MRTTERFGVPDCSPAAPIIFGSGYITLEQWWLAGFVMSVVNIAILVTVGGVWWTMLGYL